MKWMKERDLLIAQTMASVQSVTGKTPEAEKTVAASVALLSVETFETTRTAAVPDIESLLCVEPGNRAAADADLEDIDHVAADRESGVGSADMIDRFDGVAAARIVSAVKFRFLREAVKILGASINLEEKIV